jgi:hypothetical protein
MIWFRGNEFLGWKERKIRLLPDDKSPARHAVGMNSSAGKSAKSACADSCRCGVLASLTSNTRLDSYRAAVNYIN